MQHAVCALKQIHIVVSYTPGFNPKVACWECPWPASVDMALFSSLYP